MSDELTNTLMSGSRHASVSAESLELMGKQAANRFLNEDIPLNESISKLAAQHNDINGEQVKRICEFANTAVYLARHDQSKTAGANSSYPQFPLADPSRIIQDMSDGARPTISTDVDIAYSKQALKAKTASARLTELRETVIERVFGIDPEKKPEEHGTRESALNDLLNAKYTLQGMDESISTTHEHAEMTLKEAQADLFHLTKEHLLSNGSFAEIVAVAQHAEEDSQKIASALSPVIERLLTEKIASPADLRVMNDQLEKLASRTINPAHPLHVAFTTLFTASDDLQKTAAAQEEIEKEYRRVDSFIKENFLADSAR